MAHYEDNLANPPQLDGAPDRAPIEGAFFDCIPSAERAGTTSLGRRHNKGSAQKPQT